MDLLGSCASAIRKHIGFIRTTFSANVVRLFDYFQCLLDVSYRRVANILWGPFPSFSRQFESKYGMSHPRFFEGPLRTAKEKALREGKLLAIYIHSNNDSASAAIFTNDLIIDLLDANCVFFVASMTGVRLQALVQNLRATTLPHLSLFSIAPPDVQTLIAKIEDFRSVDEVFITIVNAIDNPGPLVVPARREELSSNTQIIKEQDEAFRRAVEVDMAKLLVGDMERNNDIERRRQKEALARARKELISERKELAKCYQRDSKKGDTKIKVRLPSGCTIEGLFDKEDRVQKIYDWVGISEYLSSKPIKIPYAFDLSIPCPSKKLDDWSQTLEEANLFPNASLVLISLDESDEEDL